MVLARRWLAVEDWDGDGVQDYVSVHIPVPEIVVRQRLLPSSQQG